MNIRRRLALWATTSAVACFASMVPPAVAGASPSPTSVPPNAPPPVTLPADTGPSSTDGQGQQGITESWALIPGSPNNPDESGNRTELSYVANPGAVIQDAVTVINYGNVQENFHVYATDAFNNSEGQFDLLPSDTEPADVGTWVSFPQEGITVPPGKQATIPITIKIPADATAGDHAGAIVASSPTAGIDAEGNVVTFDRRTGSRLYVRVGGPLTAELAVAGVSTDYDQAVNPFGATAHVTYRIENRGNVRLSGTATLSVAGPFGIGERKLALPDIPELLPGQELTLTADVHDVTELMFGVSKVRAQGAEVADVAAASPSEGKDLSFVPPIAVLALVLAVVLAVLARRFYRRRRSSDEEAFGVGDLEPSATDELQRQQT